MAFASAVVTAISLPPPPLALTTTKSRFLPLRRDQNPRRFPLPKKPCIQPAAAASSSSSSEGSEKSEDTSAATLLWRAAKLPIYSVALVPLTVGFTTAYLHTGLFFTRRYITLLLSSVLIITWLNLSNDVYDFDTGADRDKKESVVNIVGSRRLTQIAANISLAFGFLGLIWAFREAGDLRFILLVTCAILCGYVYQCPPFRLSYKGLGEPLCFAAFGPFATTAFYFSNSTKNSSSGIGTLPLTRTVLSASVLVGLTTTLILFCSHFHQINGDQDVGKMSPLVRLGTETGSKVVRCGVTMLYLLLFGFSLCKSLPPSCTVMCALTLPIGKLVVDFVEKNHNDKVKIFMAKYYCVRLHA
ncbi:2-carboxy-1,4-naphthoquinone phytyltransferase, chloroplastic, partial [Asparagus officinalis]